MKASEDGEEAIRGKGSKTQALRPADLPVFVLAGGLGTRLEGVWDGPKALVPVAGRPFIAYLLDELEGAGFRRIVLLAGHGVRQMEAALRERDVTLLPEPHPLGTGGALRAASPLAGAWNLILNGDSICRLRWEALLAFATASPFRLVMVASEAQDASEYGAIVHEPGGRVVAFEEKAKAGPGAVNAGIYAARGGFFARELSDDAPRDPLSLERDILPRMARDGTLGVWTTRERFWDVGTPERLAAFDEFLRRERGTPE